MTVLYSCKRCNRKVSFKEIRYNDNGKDLICEQCYTAVVKKQQVSEKPKEAQKTVSGKTLKEKYVCGKCKYKFTYKPSEADLRCSYCGSTNVLKDDYNAEKFLQEAVEMDRM